MMETSSQAALGSSHKTHRISVEVPTSSNDSLPWPHLKGLNPSTEERVDNPLGLFSKIPARYVVAFMGFWCWFVFNCLRMTISLTIVAMVNWTEIRIEKDENLSITTITCDYNRTRILVDGPLVWDVKMQGFVMAAYFYGLASSQLPSGRLAERYSAKWVILLGTLLAAITCFLSPVSSYASVYGMIVLMVLKGIGQGLMVPAFSVLAGKWFPVNERSALMAICVSGMPLGGFFTLISSGYMCQSSWGWPSVYYLWGAVGCVWVVFWYFLIYDSPMDHPKICHHELFRIMSLRTQEAARMAIKPRVPVKSIAMSLPAWSYFLVGFSSFWTISLYNIVLPTFMGTVLQFDLPTNGIMSSFPQLAQAFFLLIANFICDYLQRKKYFTPTTIRKSSMTLGLSGFLLCMIAVSFVGCEQTLNVILLTFALGLTGINFAAVMVVPVDLSPRYAGTMSGFMSIFGSLSGVLIPAVVTALSQDKSPTIEDWYIVFYLSAGLCLFTVLFFLIFGSSEVQHWNYPEIMRKSKPVMVLNESHPREFKQHKRETQDETKKRHIDLPSTSGTRMNI